MSHLATKIPKKSSRLFRLLQLLLASIGLLVLLQWWHYNSAQGQRLFAEQSSVLMRETLKALAQTAAYLIENDQLDGLNELTQQLAASPYLHDVVVYDANGVRMSESPGSDPAQLLYAPQYDVALHPMVQEIYQGKQLLGYIKISLKQDTSFSAVSGAWHDMMEQLLWMLALAGLIALMARSSLLLLSHRLVSNKILHHAALDTHEHLGRH
jgi:uncharacterized membrane protein affecting hemolysin expression